MRMPMVMLLAVLVSQADAAEIAVNALDYEGPAWSPYLVGAALGVLSWLTFYFSDKPIGASSAYATVAGMIGKLIAPRHTGALEYYKKAPPVLSWGLVFVLAAIAGGFIAALSGGEITGRWLPPIWEDRFGQGTLGLRAFVAIGGGVLMAFGARLAGGCTSGHGISGTMQLNVASWLAFICFFIGGVAVAIPLYSR
jgi:uncharacterized protein